MTASPKKILFFHDKNPDEIIPAFIANDIEILKKNMMLKSSAFTIMGHYINNVEDSV